MQFLYNNSLKSFIDQIYFQCEGERDSESYGNIQIMPKTAKLVTIFTQKFQNKNTNFSAGGAAETIKCYQNDTGTYK